MTSTLKFNRWENAAGQAIADASSGSLALGRNLLYNGAMQVAQRGTSEAGITSTGYYTADRFRHTLGTLGTWTSTIESDGPTGSGFTKSLKVECTTADAAPAAGDLFNIAQNLEGQDLQGLKKGTADAESLTISFWVKSSVTGTYVVELLDADNTRQISQAYTIASSGTWEKKTLTFSGDTTGAFDNDNATSLQVNFWLAAGSNFTSGTLNTSWASTTNANRAVGQTNLAASTSNYWQVTGVQLETGTVASGFDHKPYGVELAECQRYYQRSSGLHGGARNSTTIGVGPVFSEMRVAPTIAVEDTSFFVLEIGPSVATSRAASGASVTFSTMQVSAGNITIDGFSGLTQGSNVYTFNTGVLSLDAEL